MSKITKEMEDKFINAMMTKQEEDKRTNDSIVFCDCLFNISSVEVFSLRMNGWRYATFIDSWLRDSKIFTRSRKDDLFDVNGDLKAVVFARVHNTDFCKFYKVSITRGVLFDKFTEIVAWYE